MRIPDSVVYAVFGLGAIVFVPFKTVTHLPPYAYMMLSVIVVLAAEICTGTRFSQSKTDKKIDELEHHFPVHSDTKIELPSILFLGILTAVACLESQESFNYAEALNHAIPNKDVVVILFGMAQYR